MGAALKHRGPDDCGSWWNETLGTGLVHQRLSIIDLSQAGRQPMQSRSGRFILSYNGEVYNFRELRADLEREGCLFTSRSDTEVLVEAIEAWGLDAALNRAVGMFAFALVDLKEQRLILARDRLGIKPLYYGKVGRDFVFASELDAIRRFPGFEGNVDRQALAAYLHRSHVPSPFSIYRDICKLRPGHILQVDLAGEDANPRDHRPYWSAYHVVAPGTQESDALSWESAANRLETHITDAVRARMVTDVPLGAFLSGGIDSSLVVALMQSLSSQPVKTFTIGFAQADFDEARYAKAVAAHLGTEHSELYLSARDAREIIPQLADIYDEPFADSSQIPTALVCRHARDTVKVVLTGDGGDEVFFGYPRYALADWIWRKIGRIPIGLRRWLARAIDVTPRSVAEALVDRIGSRPLSTQRHAEYDIAAVATILRTPNPEALYSRIVAHWKAPETIVLGSREVTTSQVDAVPAALSYIEQMAFIDLVTYLPDDILTKVDRASMSIGLEARVPLLDHRLVEFAWSLPPHFKMAGVEGKLILKHLLRRHLPDELIDRPKMGFGVPLSDWLRGPLRDWMEDLLDPVKLAREGFFDVGTVREKVDQHLSGDRHWHAYLWDLLMFEAWLERRS
jgi:asparagine synthase (glutamine-hydrolysing)